MSQEDLSLALSAEVTPEALERLSHYTDPQILSSLAQNPSVPLDVLSRLWSLYPQQAFENPILPLLLLEDPAFFFRYERWPLLESLLRAESIPESFLLLIARSPHEVPRMVLAGRPDLPHWLMEELTRANFVSIRDALATNPHTPDDILMLLLEDDRLQVRLSVLTRPALANHLWERAASNLYPQIRMKAAERAEAAALLGLANDPDSSVREATARSERLPDEGAERLVRDPLRQVREALASNPKTPEEVLLRLAADPERAVRAAVARRLTVTAPLFAVLHQDPSRYIRRIIASREDLPDIIWQRIGGERDALIEEELRYSTMRAEIKAQFEARIAQIDSIHLCGFASMFAFQQATDEYRRQMRALEESE